MITRRYVGKREEKPPTEYEKLVSLLCFVKLSPFSFGNSLTFSHIPPCCHAKPVLNIKNPPWSARIVCSCLTIIATLIGYVTFDQMR